MIFQPLPLPTFSYTLKSNILIVDDVPENLGVLFRTIEGENVDVQVAITGEKALEIASEHPPDLILMDVMMPGIDGFETCRRLKKMARTRHIPVIFLTAYEDIENVLKGFRVGGADYMTKPFQHEEVLARVRLYLEQVYLERKLAAKNRELTDVNVYLDEQVKIRTKELQQKALELENRDRIAQQLLKVPTLHQSLNIILEGLTQVVDLDRAVVYLHTEGGFKAAAAIGAFESGTMVGQTELDEALPLFTCGEGFDEIKKETVCIDTEGLCGALVPVLRNESILGLIEATRSCPFDSEMQKTLKGFALQTAIAIINARAEKKKKRSIIP